MREAPVTRLLGRALSVALVLAAASSSLAVQEKGGGPRRPAPTPEPGAPAKWQILGIEQAVLLDGRPFPPKPSSQVTLPSPLRTFWVSPQGAVDSDGSAQRPWRDLAAAACRLVPGDRLVLGKGTYEGGVRIGDRCRDGKPGVPIQIVGESASLRAPAEGSALEIGRSDWLVSNLRVVRSEKSGAPLVVVSGSARGVTLDRLRLEIGGGAGLAILSGAERVTVAAMSVRGRQDVATNMESAGVRVAPNTREVTLVGLSVVNAAGPAVLVGAREGEPPRVVSVLGASILNSPGPAIWIVSGEAVHIAGCDLVQLHPARVGRGEAVRIERATSLSPG